MASEEERKLSLELLILVFWLAKDFGWVLLSPVLVLHVKLLMVPGSRFVFVHEVAGVCWLLGNALWMIYEFSFCDLKANKKLLPWAPKAFVGDNPQAYDHGLVLARCCFYVGLLVLLGSYLSYATGRWSWECRETRTPSTSAASLSSADALVAPSDEEPRLVFGLLTPHEYAQLFMAPWILKDLMWTYSLFLPGISCSVIVIAHLLDCLRRRASLDTVPVEIYWALANSVWMFGELFRHDRYLSMRVCAAGLLLIGASRALWRFTSSLHQKVQCDLDFDGDKAAAKSLPTEQTPLMHK